MSRNPGRHTARWCLNSLVGAWLGIVAFALNFIPVVGSLVAGGYLLINNFMGNFLEPILVGRRFGISTLVVVIAVMFWGWVWGAAWHVVGGAADDGAEGGAGWQ